MMASLPWRNFSQILHRRCRTSPAIMKLIKFTFRTNRTNEKKGLRSNLYLSRFSSLKIETGKILITHGMTEKLVLLRKQKQQSKTHLFLITSLFLFVSVTTSKWQILHISSNCKQNVLFLQQIYSIRFSPILHFAILNTFLIGMTFVLRWNWIWKYGLKMELNISAFVQILCIVKGNHFHRVMLSGTTAQNHPSWQRAREDRCRTHTVSLHRPRAAHTIFTIWWLLKLWQHSYAKKAMQNLSIKLYVFIYAKKIFWRKNDNKVKFVNIYVVYMPTDTPYH